MSSALSHSENQSSILLPLLLHSESTFPHLEGRITRRAAWFTIV
jgi:hypothetical protein